VEQNLRILRIVLVPGVVHRLACAGYSKRRNQFQVKALGLQKMSQGTMVVASGFETETDREVETVQVVGKATELNCSVK
jgi:hypothetical protein